MFKELYCKVLFQDTEALEEWRLTVSESDYGVQYLGLRKYFLDFSGAFLPSKEGISIPLNLVFTMNLLEGLYGIVSHAESSEIREAILELQKTEDCNE